MKAERLNEINKEGYLKKHHFNQEDINKIQNVLDLLSYHHIANDEPKVGDIVEGAYYNGTYQYSNGRIESIDQNTVTICCHPYVPFVTFNEKGRPHLNISGGPFITCRREELEFVKDDKAQYKFWGHAGACANGAINVETYVGRWKVPYEKIPVSFVIEIEKENTNINPNLDARVILYKDHLFQFARFNSMKQIEDLSRIMGFQIIPDETGSRPGYRRYRLSHQLTEGPGFWRRSSLPKDAKPFKTYSNGNLCTCYFIKDDKEKEIKIYRPNPNSKEVYDALSIQEHIRYKNLHGDAGPAYNEAS